LVYGEITFTSFGLVFEKVRGEDPARTPRGLAWPVTRRCLPLQIRKVYGQPNVGTSGPKGYLQEPGGLFYDVGSGTGKPVGPPLPAPGRSGATGLWVC
jgi:hypothetical protein